MEAQPGIQTTPQVKSGLVGRLTQRYGKWVGKITGALGDQALFAISNFLVNVLLARWMSPTEYGAFVVAYSWLLLPQNFYEAVLIEPMVIFGAGKYSKFFKSYLGYVFYGHLITSGLVALSLLLGALFVYVFDSQLVASALMGAGLAAPLILTRWLTRRPFYVTSKPHLAAFGAGFYLVLVVILLGAVRLYDVNNFPPNYCTSVETVYANCQFFNYEHLLTPFTALMIMGVAGLIASIFLTVFFIKPNFRPPPQEEMNARTIIKDHFDYGKWASGSRVLIWVPTNVYYLVLPIFMSLAESGALRALNNLTLPIFMSMSAITSILMPTFVRTFRSRGKKGMAQRMNKIVLLSLFFTGSYFVVMSVFGFWIMDVLYAGKFNDFVTLPILMTMVAVPLFTGVRSVMDAALRAMGGVKHSFISKIIPTVFTLTIGVFMLANIGILGVMLSNLITSIVSLLTLWWFYRRTNPEPPIKEEESAEETA